MEKEKNNEVLEQWIEAPDLEFTKIDNYSSLKTNFLFVQRNFENLRKYLINLKAYLRYLKNLIDPDKLLADLLEKIRSQKTCIELIPNNLQNIGSIDYYKNELTGENYKIERNDMYSFTISSAIENKPLNAVGLIVTVKNLENTIVYPVIQTLSDSIKIYFADGLTTTYKVYMI